MVRDIYKKYINKDKRNEYNRKLDKHYFDFLRDLKEIFESGTRIITIDNIHYLIRRHSYQATTGYTSTKWKSKPRTYYFIFWIKRAKDGGFIEQDKEGLGWVLKDKLLNIV